MEPLDTQTTPVVTPPLQPHRHTGIDSPTVDLTKNNIFPCAYNSMEYNIGSVASTATVNWVNGNVQYVTLTANTTFTFTNPQPGLRCILHVAGAFTPTWPANVRWSGGVAPTATASSGHKDLVSFVYSGIEGLYDGIQSANFAIT